MKVNYTNELVAGEIDCKKNWKSTLRYQRLEFPNLSLLAQIIITLSGSNSSVERSFSTLTTILTDRRLKMSHTTLEMLMIIKCNDRNWTEQERENIIQRATDLHPRKKEKKRGWTQFQ